MPSCTETAWGLERVHVGCRARALENQMIVANASTVGEATWTEAVDYNTGRACVFVPPDLGFPSSGVLARGQLNEKQWIYCEIDLQLVRNVRQNGQVFNYKKMPFFMQKNSKIMVKQVQF